MNCPIILSRMADTDEQPEMTPEERAQHTASVEARRQRVEAMFEGKPIAPPKLVREGYPVGILERVEQGDEAAVDEIGVWLHKRATEAMRRGRGGMMLTAYVFCRNCPMGGLEPNPLYTTSITTDKGHGYKAWPIKDLVCDLVHGIATMGDARAVAFMMESWRVRAEPDAPVPRNVDFGTLPGSIEAVAVSIETKTLTRVWHGDIVRYGGVGFVIKPFEKYPSEGKFGGRFFGLMQPGYDPQKAAHPKEWTEATKD